MSKKTVRPHINIALYAPALLWMAVIFYLSSVPGNGAVYEMPRVMLVERKGAHIFEYFILTLLFLRIFIAYLPKHRIRALWLSAFLTLIYAVSDETHQLFVFGRTGKVEDVLIDGIGVCIAMSIVLLLRTKFASKSAQEQVTNLLLRFKTRRRGYKPRLATGSKRQKTDDDLLRKKKKPRMRVKK